LICVFPAAAAVSPMQIRGSSDLEASLVRRLKHFFTTVLEKTSSLGELPHPLNWITFLLTLAN
jgi:hypothetical protein